MLLAQALAAALGSFAISSMTWLHFGHSNIRSSMPPALGERRINRVFAEHFEQGGRTIWGVSGSIGHCSPLEDIGRELLTLITDKSHGSGGDAEMVKGYCPNSQWTIFLSLSLEQIVRLVL